MRAVRRGARVRVRRRGGGSVALGGAALALLALGGVVRAQGVPLPAGTVAERDPPVPARAGCAGSPGGAGEEAEVPIADDGGGRAEPDGRRAGRTTDAPAPRGGPLGCADPPGAVRVALVDSGVNYTLPSIARALARDPDGTPVGHDFWDLDARPFDRHPARGGRIVRHGTRTASVLIEEAPRARLVPYRYPRPDMSRMRDLVAHAAAAGVRVVGLPLGGNRREDWAAFEAAARAHPAMLFVASAGNDGRDIDERPVWPAALDLDNLVVVTSSDDFGALAEGVNRGRRGVDYLVPAEHVEVTRFDGSRGVASGSSYAVPRVVALAARLLEVHPHWHAPELVAELRRRFADGTHSRVVGEGVIADPLAVGERAARVVAERTWAAAASRGGPTRRSGPSSASRSPLAVPLDALVPNGAWSAARVDATLARAASILAACGLHLAPVRVRAVDAPARLADLSTGGARTLFEAVRASGPERRATVVFARDTRMGDPHDGEAFGRANTRHRPWLADSVWLTAAIRDAGIALAHELVHVLANSGEHHPASGNLMHARTSGDNVALEPGQCERARRTALGSGLALPARETSADGGEAGAR